MLAIKNKHPMDSRIQFEESTHIYTIDGDTSFTSVTTFVHHQFPAFHAEEVIKSLLAEKKANGRPNENKYRKEAIVNLLEKHQNLSQMEATALINDTKSTYYKAAADAIATKWKETSTSGTKIHADIEYFYNDLPQENDSIEYRFFEAFRKDFERDFPQYRPYRTEWTVFHKELKIAGSIDMVFENVEDGTLMIYDWKRVKSIEYDSYGGEGGLGKCADLPNTNFWHYSMQLNTYRAILESEYGKTVSKLMLVRLYPDAPNYELHECHDLRDRVAELFEERRERSAYRH